MPLLIGEFHLDPSTGLLTRPSNPGSPMRLEPKVTAVLVYLAEHPNQVVSRRELLDAIWPGVVVTDEVLTRCISELRNAFGDERTHARYIETLHKRGYRLLARVVTPPADSVTADPDPHATATMTPSDAAAAGHEIDGVAPPPVAGAADAAPVSSPHPDADLTATPRIATTETALVGGGRAVRSGHRWPITIAALLTLALALAFWLQGREDPDLPPPADPVLAVLPFTDLSPGHSYDYFAQGLTDELHTVLYRVAGLELIARTRSARYQASLSSGRMDAQAIGKALDASAVLEGSVRREGDRVRVNARLVDVSTGKQTWAQAYDRRLADVFSIQDDIAQSIAGALRFQLAVPLKVARPSQSLEAVDLYLLGRYYWNQRTQESLTRALDFFHRALEKDDHFALACVGIADSHLLRLNYGYATAAETLPAAQEYLDRALAIDPELPEALSTQGLLLGQQGEAVAAERVLTKAIDKQPGNPNAHLWLGVALEKQGRMAEALDAFEQAYALDPTSVPLIYNLVTTEIESGRPQEAFARVTDAQALGAHHYRVDVAKIEALLALNRWSEALGLAKKVVAAAPNDPLSYKTLAKIWIVLNRLDRAEAALAAAPSAISGTPALVNIRRVVAAYRGDQDYVATHRSDDADELAHLEEGLSLLTRGDRKAAAPKLAAALMAAKTPAERLDVMSYRWLAPSAPIGEEDEVGDTEEVTAEFERALEQSAHDGLAPSLVAFYRAVLSVASGDRDAAIAALKTQPLQLTPFLLEHDVRFVPLHDHPIWQQWTTAANERVGTLD